MQVSAGVRRTPSAVGSTYIDYGDLGFWAWDGTLEVWYGLIGTAARGVHPGSAWLAELSEHWLQLARERWSGVMVARLDEYLTSEERRLVVLELAETCLARLKQGDPLHARWLNTVTDSGKTVWTGWREDQPCDPFVPVGEAFVALLAGDVESLTVAAEQEHSPNDIHLNRRLTSR